MSAVAIQADDINREHQLARQSAESAVEHAIRCGQLLADVKAALPHGQFGRWIEANCEFERSTATRYLKAAKQFATGVAIPSLSHLFPSGQPTEPQHQKAPNWLPKPGNIAVGASTRGLIACQESEKHPGYYDLLVVDYLDDGSGVETRTNRPVAGRGVGLMLKAAGVDLHSMSWTQSPAHSGAIQGWLS